MTSDEPCLTTYRPSSILRKAELFWRAFSMV